jgi:predicted DNA-binding transcriptional regulator AlpA
MSRTQDVETKIAEKLLRKVDVAKILNCSGRSLERYCTARRIPAPVRISGARRWKLTDITLFLECNCDMVKFQARKEQELC